MSAEEFEVLRLSLQSASLAILLSIIPAIWFARFLTNTKHMYSKTIFETLISIPMVVPPVVTGTVLLMLLGRRGLLSFIPEFLGFPIAFHFPALVLATGVVSFPMMVTSFRSAFEMVDKRFEEVAWTLGKSRIRTFLTLTLPLSLHGLIGGIILAFARGMGEFGASITLAGNIEGETRTLPLAIFTALQTPDQEGVAMRLVIISILISMLAIILSSFFRNRIQKA